jgi:hypothetical protein
MCRVRPWIIEEPFYKAGDASYEDLRRMGGEDERTLVRSDWRDDG